MKTINLLLTLVITMSTTLASAKHGGQGNGGNAASSVGGGACHTENIFPHARPDIAPFYKITCDFKEFLYLASKGEHCIENATARVIYLDNCSPAPGMNSTISYEIALTTYFPGRHCWSEEDHSAYIDNLGFKELAIGTRVELTVGQIGGGVVGYTGGGTDEDVHAINIIGGKSGCTTNHETNGKQMTGIRPHILSLVDVNNTWLRETN